MGCSRILVKQRYINGSIIYGNISNCVSSNVCMYNSTNKTMGIYGRMEKEAIKRFKKAESAHQEFIHKPIHVGNGILDQIKPAEPVTLKVEDLYEVWDPIYWDILDKLFEDRVDLRDRIKRYKESRVA